MAGPIVLSEDDAVEFLHGLLSPDKEKITEINKRLSDISISRRDNGFVAEIPELNLDFIRKD